MRAILFERTGNPEEVLFLGQCPPPEPGPGELRVRMQARPVNPSDTLFVEGRYGRRPQFTLEHGHARHASVVGFEGAGTVDKIGPDTDTGVEPGTRVAVAATGTWQEYVVVAEEDVLLVPDRLSIDAACLMTINPFTAHLLLDALALAQGEALLLTAATSAVSGMLVSLARQRGIRCICLLRDPEHGDRLLGLGADESLTGDLVDRIRSLAGPGGVAAAVDAVGGRTGEFCLRCLRDEGRLMVYGLISGAPVPVSPADLIFRGITVEGFWLPERLRRLDCDTVRKLTATVAQQLTDHTLDTSVAAYYDLADFRAALAHHARRGRRGKIILTG
jgi:NADPH:quinone reductase-like Zn-dependent oxidoreductase